MSQQETLRLIKEAADNGVTELDLSSQELMELPVGLGQLPNIRGWLRALWSAPAGPASNIVGNSC